MSASPLTIPHTPDPDAFVTLRSVGHRTVVSVAGEVDLATAPALSAAMHGALDRGALELWVDLTGTAFMDSSGLHVLIVAQARVQELNRRFAVICPPGNVRRLFEVAGVSDRLPLYDGRAAAHASA